MTQPPELHTQCAHAVLPSAHTWQYAGSTPVQSLAELHCWLGVQNSTRHSPSTHAKLAQRSLGYGQGGQIVGNAPVQSAADLQVCKPPDVEDAEVPHASISNGMKMTNARFMNFPSRTCSAL